MLFELIVFAIASTVIVVVLAACIYVIGLPFQLTFGFALFASFYGFAVLFPGGYNVVIGLFGTGGEDRLQRLCAFVRGVSMVAGSAFGIMLGAPRNALTPYLPWLAGICLALFLWSIVREVIHDNAGLPLTPPSSKEPDDG